jgi:ATP-binding protein involved in chromosome partitioning
MPELTAALLTQHLNQLVVRETGRPLGSAGTTIAVEARNGGWHVAVSCGYPLARSVDQLRAAITAHCAPILAGAPLTVAIESSIVAHSVQHGLKPLPGVRNLVAVASGKGGVGKSTVAVNIALALAQEGARVGVLDADIYGPSQPRMLGLLGRRPETREGKSLEPMAWRGPMVTSALNQLLTQTNWGDLDYLIVDMPPGTGDIQLTLAQRVPVSGAVIVTTPQDIAIADARKGLEMFQKVNVPVLGVVENMSLHVCTNCGHEEHIFGEHGGETLSSQYGVPLLGALPLDRRIRVETDEGKPTVVAEPDGALARAFRDVALRAAGELAARTKDYSRLFPSISVEDD